MKRFPIPDRPIKTKKEGRLYVEELVFNSMQWLNIFGYVFTVHFPGDDDFREASGSGACIVVEYPYKEFKISIQEHSWKLFQSESPKNTGFWNNVESSILHECVHILVWPLAEMANRRYTTQEDIRDCEERLTSHLENLIHPFMRSSRKKKA